MIIMDYDKINDGLYDLLYNYFKSNDIKVTACGTVMADSKMLAEFATRDVMNMLEEYNN